MNHIRGERDVIRLRNPTEDKRAFRRMLTSADRTPLYAPTTIKPATEDIFSYDTTPRLQKSKVTDAEVKWLPKEYFFS